MKQRKAVDGGIALVEAVHLCEAPGGVDLIAVRQPHELRAPGRAAGVKERANGVAIGRQREVERVALYGRARVEACKPTALIAVAADHQDVPQRRHAINNRKGFLPQRGIGRGGGNDQHGRLFGDQKVGDGVGIEQKVDRAGDTGDLRAKECWVQGRQGRTQEGHRTAGCRYAERPEKIGRAGYRIEQILVRERDRALIRITGRITVRAGRAGCSAAVASNT